MHSILLCLSAALAAIPEGSNGLQKSLDCLQIAHFNKNYYEIVGSCPHPLIDNGSQLEITDIHAKCSDVPDNQIAKIPVTDEPRQITYRNIFCAICHGMFFNITRWDMQIDCQGGVSINPSLTDLDLSHCKFSLLKPRNVLLSKCYRETKRDTFSIFTEPSIETRENQPNMLQLGYSTLLNFGFDGQSHRLLMTSTEDGFLQLTECGSGKIYNPARKECIQLDCPADQVTFFDRCVTQIKTNDSDYCFDLKVSYNILPGTDHGRLKVPMIYAFLEAYSISLEDVNIIELSQDGSSSCQSQRPKNSIIQLITNNTSLLSDPHCQSEDGVETGTKLISISHNKVGANGNFSSDHSLFPIVDLTSDRSGIAMIGCAITTEITSHQIQERWCHGFVRFYKNDEIEVRVQGHNITALTVLPTNLTYTREHFSYTEVVNGNFWGNISKIAFVCDEIPQIKNNGSCARMALEPWEYEIYPNRSINVFYLQDIVDFVNEVAEHRETFKIGDFKEPIPTIFSMEEYEYDPAALENSSFFSFANQTVQICIPSQVITLLQQLTALKYIEIASSCSAMNTFGHVSSYFGLGCSILSFLSMIIVLITFSLFRSMRTLPGINLMNLTVAIFLSQALFLSSEFINFGADDPQNGCFIMAILTHFCILASFMWMNVMAYTSYRAFGADFKTRVAKLDKRSIFYNSLYAWSLPGVIVLVCGIVDFVYRDRQYINYGIVTAVKIVENTNPDGSISSLKVVYRKTSACWIGNSTAALIIFGLPLIYCMLFNIVLFCKTCIGMRGKAEFGRPKTILRRDSGSGMLKNRSDMHIHIRLMAQYGFAWIIAIVIIVVGTTKAESDAVCWTLHILNFIFNVLHGCTGLFLFFAFILNRRTWFLYKHKFLNKKVKPKRSISYKSSVMISSLYSITNSTEVNINVNHS